MNCREASAGGNSRWQATSQSHDLWRGNALADASCVRTAVPDIEVNPGRHHPVERYKNALIIYD